MEKDQAYMKVVRPSRMPLLIFSGSMDNAPDATGMKTTWERIVLCRPSAVQDTTGDDVPVQVVMIQRPVDGLVEETDHTKRMYHCL